MDVLRWALGPLVAAAALVSACGGSSEPVATPGPATTPAHSRPPTLSWERTGEYRTERMGIGLSVHSYIVNWDYIAILYSLDHSTPGLDASAETVALAGDLGESYDVVSNPILGTSLGVTVGVLTVEPYKGQGKTLTLTVTDVTASSGGRSPGDAVPGTWSVTFIENQFPGAVVDYTQGGRIAPELMLEGELTLALGGPPGGRFIKLLIDRAGEQDALYGRISDGVAQPLTEEEFRELAPYDYPPPHGWPAPEAIQ